MLVKIDNVAVETTQVVAVYGETTGIDRPRTITWIRLLDGTRIRCNNSPAYVMEKLGVK